MRPIMPWLALALGAAACQTDRPTTPSTAALTSRREGTVRVYTQNLYIGTDVDKVIAAPPAQLPAALLQALATFVATDYPSRAGRIADEIAVQKPDLIGLQEVTHLTVTGLGIVGFPDVDVDFIPILSAQLVARGLQYDVVAVSPNTDITIPLPLPNGSFGLIALKDHDAILVRHGIQSSNVVTKNFQAKVSTSLGPIPLEILRGYAAADVTVRGRSYRFVTTHPEPRGTGLPIQAAQAAELISDLASTTVPLIVVGDFNSAPSAPEAEAPYNQMLAAGYLDTWTRRNTEPGDGPTCCQIEDLTNPVSAHTQRIDLIFVKNPSAPAGPLGGPVQIKLFGDQAEEKTSNGLWPSDHAGLFESLRLASERID
ncbi:MAG TPA: endonuclease/exonuclease/phosphatase family protein [Gemmatimonadales bacterium]|nr:endonuclease/exonuclease/phosphatase family protein [Gemmatimonadales bacterium]